MTADLFGSNFSDIFTSMNSYFEPQKVGETTTGASSSKPVSIIGRIKAFWTGLTTIEKVFLVFILLVIVFIIVGYITGD